MRWLRIDDVKAKTSLAKSTIYRMVSEGRFPKPCTPPGAGFAVWVESELDQWMEKQVNSARGVPEIDPRESKIVAKLAEEA